MYPPAAAPPAPPRRSGGLSGCLIAALVVVLLVVGSCLAAIALLARECDPPAQDANPAGSRAGAMAAALLADVRAEDWDGVHARMAAAFESYWTPERVRDAVARVPSLARHTGFEVLAVRYEGNTGPTADRCVLNALVLVADVDGTLQTPAGPVRVTVHAIREAGRWRFKQIVTPDGRVGGFGAHGPPLYRGERR